jgi:hypothetical protein
MTERRLPGGRSFGAVRAGGALVGFVDWDSKPHQNGPSFQPDQTDIMN